MAQSKISYFDINFSIWWEINVEKPEFFQTQAIATFFIYTLHAQKYSIPSLVRIGQVHDLIKINYISKSLLGNTVIFL